LRSIYILQTQGIDSLIQEIVGPLHKYKGSLFRLAVIYGVTTYVTSRSINSILLDIIDMSDILLPLECSEREKVHNKLKTIAECRENIVCVDLMMVIDTYLAFGKYLHPAFIDI
jgi:hypothetical protein